ncbi:MAG TPA: hypothetical protein IAB31_04170 [Candidatus Choladousia intestinavium]|uniref:Uncharacterized protein n=1 Tax=Candidatus Choladousia intestinavium TaxID=2840727 RepID=A0A9D1AAU5_9FIRM|nr:hypothetical protein [Candidatus Choladousia intestinavium]
MKYAKNVSLKNDKKCLIRNATGDDAQAVLNVFLLTHEQTDFLSSYRDEASFGAAFEKQFLTSQKPRSKLRGIKFAAQQSCGVFDPRGSRQMDMQACPLGSLLAGIKRARTGKLISVLLSTDILLGPPM